MKKSLLLLTAFLCAGMAQAVDYPYLVFFNTAGTATVFSITDWSATVSGTSLQVTNKDGSLSLTLADLESMQFSDNASAIENVLDADAPVSVFALTGTALGVFDNMKQAAEVLGAGSYVVSNGKNAQTIVVK